MKVEIEFDKVEKDYKLTKRRKKIFTLIAIILAALSYVVITDTAPTRLSIFLNTLNLAFCLGGVLISYLKEQELILLLDEVTYRHFNKPYEHSSKDLLKMGLDHNN